MILVFWMLSFKTTFSLSYFSFIMRLFSFSISAIRVVSSAYLRLLIFLLVMLIPACASCSLAFHMMYAAYKINKQANNMQPWHTPFPTWNHSVVPCLVLTIASWPAYRFLRWQAGQVVWYSHLFQNFSKFVVIHSVKSFNIGIIANVFLKLSCFFDDPTHVGNLISGSSGFSKCSLNTLKFSSHTV